jgi:hypothetical protein
MPAQLIEKALAEWREGERLLKDLPRLDPDHETVRMAVIGLRDTYTQLSRLNSDATDQIADCRRSIERAHEAIVRVRTKLDAAASRQALTD